ARALPTSLGRGFDVARCVDVVRARGLRYAGLQWHGECYGGDNLGRSPAPEIECNTTCDANPAQVCGGAWRNSIFDTGALPPAPPPPAPPPPPPPPSGAGILFRMNSAVSAAPTYGFDGSWLT